MKHALRWRWKFGIAAPLLLAVAIIASWYYAERNTSPEPIDARPAIAVLPFLDQGDDRSREYLADGLTQDIIHSLGRFSALTVMSWNAVAGYKGALAKPGEIARVLGVRYQVEGSVRYTDDRVRVSAQLVDAQGRVLWSSRFDEAAADVFQLQDRMTREIAGALAIRVTEFEQQRVARKRTASFDAYDCVLRARPALQRPTRQAPGRRPDDRVPARLGRRVCRARDAARHAGPIAATRRRPHRRARRDHRRPDRQCRKPRGSSDRRRQRGTSAGYCGHHRRGAAVARRAGPARAAAHL